jgi:hypothetical protein
MTAQQLLAVLDAAVDRFERLTRTTCRFDRRAVQWLDDLLATLRPARPGEIPTLVHELGAFLGHCFVVSFGGHWVRVDAQSGLAVRLAGNVVVIPWNKVAGFLQGDDGDSPLGFFDAVSRHYAGRDFERPHIVY